jgi:hypothetical protein
MPTGFGGVPPRRLSQRLAIAASRCGRWGGAGESDAALQRAPRGIAAPTTLPEGSLQTGVLSQRERTMGTDLSTDVQTGNRSGQRRRPLALAGLVAVLAAASPGCTSEQIGAALLGLLSLLGQAWAYSWWIQNIQCASPVFSC